MAGRTEGKVSKKRSDTGTKRQSYKIKHDPTGKTFKENPALKSFWSKNKMEDVIQLSTKELDLLICEWLEDFKKRQLKSDPWWWFPEIHYDPTPKKKVPRKINTSFNSTFVQKKVI